MIFVYILATYQTLPLYWLLIPHTLISNTSLPSKPKFPPTATLETPQSTFCYYESTLSPKLIRKIHVSFITYVILQLNNYIKIKIFPIKFAE